MAALLIALFRFFFSMSSLDPLAFSESLTACVAPLHLMSKHLPRSFNPMDQIEHWLPYHQCYVSFFGHVLFVGWLKLWVCLKPLGIDEHELYD